MLVLAEPADPDTGTSENAIADFINNETELLSAAMVRGGLTVTRFNPEFAANTAQLAIVVVILSWLTIVVYLWLRFGSFRWGLAAVVCLIHDVVIVVGLIAASGWLAGSLVGEALGIASFKIDLPMIAAILTIIGYSVNDTIVVFDRIRENRGKLKALSGNIINRSINQTLPRTILTSLTTLLAVLTMYIWGGPGIRSFNYALLAGIIFGTYSSVAVASPLLLGFKGALVARISGEDIEA
jgi:SecD/SecF fusion protein